MGKSARERDLPDNEAKAVARMLRVSPQKLNLVAQLIRGKKVAMALSDLQFSQKRIAKEVKKCLESAIANAENNHDLDVDELIGQSFHELPIVGTNGFGSEEACRVFALLLMGLALHKKNRFMGYSGELCQPFCTKPSLLRSTTT